MSKHFNDDEIKYVLNGIIHLKQGVRRRPKAFQTYWDEMEEHFSHINYVAIFMEKVQKAINIREDESNYN